MCFERDLWPPNKCVSMQETSRDHKAKGREVPLEGPPEQQDQALLLEDQPLLIILIKRENEKHFRLMGPPRLSWLLSQQL